MHKVYFNLLHFLHTPKVQVLEKTLRAMYTSCKSKLCNLTNLNLNESEQLSEPYLHIPPV